MWLDWGLVLMLICGDALTVMNKMRPRSVDLVFTSPPYEDCRTYGIGFNLKGQDWVDWCVAWIGAATRVCRGLVAVVVAGKTRNYKWSATPALLMADLHRAGFNLRCPPIYSRNGIPGSGGTDWLRNDYEWIVCVSPKGKLVWSDSLALGQPCKYGPGGTFGNRNNDGTRANNGKQKLELGKPYVPPPKANPGNIIMNKTTTSGYNEDGSCRIIKKEYTIPNKRNPGNLIHCNSGGGKLGSKLAHENETPFSEKLAEFFIRSFCPPNGTVLDPFCGSGTVPAVAIAHGRNYIGIDVRQSQIELSTRRIAEAQDRLNARP
jgi:DNA modification methylase